MQRIVADLVEAGFTPVETAVDHLVKEEGFELVGLLKGAAEYGDLNVTHQDVYPVCREQIETRSVNSDTTRKEEIAVVSSSNKTTPIPNTFSSPAHLRQFPSRTCLVLDKKSRGLSWNLAQHCSAFVHIPHFPPINNKQGVTTEACLSIVLYEFTAWAGFDDQNYKGQKYHVKQVRKGTEGDPQLLEKKRLEREQKKQAQRAESDAFDDTKHSIFQDESPIHDGDY